MCARCARTLAEADSTKSANSVARKENAAPSIGKPQANGSCAPVIAGKLPSRPHVN